MYLLLLIVLVRLLIYLYPFTVTEKLPYKIQQYSHHNGIPLLIHRTENNRYTNRKMFTYCHKKWVDLNPLYQIRWYSANQRESFLKEFDVNAYNAYKTLKPGAFKTDLWRLCILYQYGGIYVDAHTTPFKSLESIIKYTRNQEHNFISALDCKEAGGGIHNGFMISSSKHPFLMQCINDIVKNVETRNYTDHTLGVTGPVCLSRAIHKVVNNKNDFRVGYNYYGQFTFYLLKFEWGISQYIIDKGSIVMSKKYNILEYLNSKVINKKKGYNYMWKNKLLYEDL